MPIKPDLTLTFPNATERHNRGRNNYFAAHGVQLCAQGSGDVAVYGMSSKGSVSMGARIMIHREALREVAEWLLEASKSPEEAERDARVALGNRVAADRAARHAAEE